MEIAELGKPLRPGNNAKIAVQDDTEKRKKWMLFLKLNSKTKSYV